MVTFRTPIPNTREEIRTGIRELRRYEDRQAAIEEEVWVWFFWGTLLIAFISIINSFSNLVINLILTATTISTVGLFVLFTVVSVGHEKKIQEWKTAERVIQRRATSTQIPTESIFNPNVIFEQQAQNTDAPKRKRNRNRKEIKSDIAKLSEKHRRELVQQLYETYIKLPDPEIGTENNRWSDLDVISESEIEQEIEPVSQTHEDDKDDDE
jgi:hypothetical protein